MTENFNDEIELQATSGSDDEFDGLDMAPSNPKKRQAILIAVLALLLLGGGGFFAYTVFLSGADEFVPPPAPVIAEAPAPEVVPPLPESAPDAVAAVDAATGPVVTDEHAPTAPDAAAPATVDETITAATEPAPAVVAPEIVPPTDSAAVVPAPVTDPAAATPAALPTVVEAIAAVDAATTPDATAPVAVPVPSDQQLQPIDPNAPKTASDKNAATAEAVKEILGTDAALPSAEAQEILAQQVEVTPHIKQVIVVHKTASAKSAQAINAAGDRVLAAGQYGNAISIYDQQLKQNPSDPISLAGKANALQKAGRDAEAMAVYQRLLDLNPRDLEALTNYLGILQKQKPEEALSRLNALAVQYPDSGAVSGQLAMTQATLMDTPAALKAFQKAIALDPSNPIYPFNMGVLFDRLGSTDKARDAYRHAIEITRQFPEKSSTVPVEIIRQRLAALSN